MSNTNYPGAIDSPYDPTTTDTLATANHHTLHGLVNDAIVAAETKLGIGSSNQTPAANQLLLGNGAGTTAWGPITPAYATGSTTGTGNFALSASPTFTGTLVAAALGVSGNATVGGTLGVTGVATFTAVPVLPAGTNKLGYNAVTANGTVASTSFVTFTTTPLAVTFTMPAGGRDAKVTVTGSFSGSGLGFAQSLAVYEGATNLGQITWSQSVANNYTPVTFVIDVPTPTAGSHTYTLYGAAASGTLTMQASAGGAGVSGAATILVEAI